MDMFDFNDAGYWLEPDFVLSDIVLTLVNAMGMPIGITLFMKGMVVSGVMVSEREYLRSLTEVFNHVARETVKAVEGEEAEAEELLENIFDFTIMSEMNDIDEDDEDLEPEDLELPTPIRHVHLKDVTVVTPQPAISFGQSMLPIMRIRLANIDGWLLGQALTVDDIESPDEPTVLH